MNERKANKVDKERERERERDEREREGTDSVTDRAGRQFRRKKINPD